MTTENKILEKHTLVSQERIASQREFTKHLITVGTGFLALFVGLKSDTIPNINSKYFYILTIILLVIGIVSLSISLYVEIYFHDQHQKFLKDYMRNILDNKPNSNFRSVNKPWYYKMCEFIGFASFILSAVSLVVYIYFLELSPILK